MARWAAQIDYWIRIDHNQNGDDHGKLTISNRLLCLASPFQNYLTTSIFVITNNCLLGLVQEDLSVAQDLTGCLVKKKIWTPGFRKLFCLRPRYTFSTLVLLSCNLCVTLLLTGASWCYFLEWVADMQLIATTPQKGPYIGVCSSSNSFFLLQ